MSVIVAGCAGRMPTSLTHDTNPGFRVSGRLPWAETVRSVAPPEEDTCSVCVLPRSLHLGSSTLCPMCLVPWPALPCVPSLSWLMAKRLTASESSESFKQVSKCEILERRHFTKGDVGMTNQRRRDVLPCESLENQRELPFPPAGVVGINPAIHPRQTESCVYSDSFVNIYSNIIHCSPKLGNSAVHQLVNGYTNVLGPWVDGAPFSS